ncbi:hypothetical protein [Flavobacterium aquiphilum]|uniref:hypothetical protein n=1 Tax=Flavobacterium aquiphilum TaxID=3003261 RepID=UPI0024811757|nr:hypothetical protein [Flavobacterium aquiphilum]
MSQMITKDGELIRISPKKSTTIEYSTTSGRSWHTRSSSTSYGEFYDLTDAGKELLANTSKGLYYSTTNGRSWHRRG